MHRNINPELLFWDEKLFKLYLIDLGTACNFPCDELLTTNLIFTAPEILLSQE